MFEREAIVPTHICATFHHFSKCAPFVHPCSH